MANVTTRSAPLSRATSAVLSVDPSSMTRTATLEKPGIVRGSAASARGRVSSSFNAGIWITSIIARVRSTKAGPAFEHTGSRLSRRFDRSFGLLLLGDHDPEIGSDPVLLEQMVFQSDQPSQQTGRVAPKPFHVETRKHEPENVAAVGAVGEHSEKARNLRRDRARADGLERIVERERNRELRPVLDLRGERVERAAREGPLGIGPFRPRRPHVLVQIEESSGLEALPHLRQHSLDGADVME